MPNATAPQILAALRQRLLDARTPTDPAAASHDYPLDDQVLPAAGDGAPGAVRTALAAALLPRDATAPLKVTATTDPVLTPASAETPDTLTLTGTSAVLTGDSATTATIVFTVSDDLLLQATWTVARSGGDCLADVFDVLDEGGFGLLVLNPASFIATTFAHTDPDVYFPLQAGLHFQGTLPVRSDLRPATGAADEAGVQHVVIGGPLDVSADGRPQFGWTGSAPLGPLTISRVGQPALALTGGVVSLSSARTNDTSHNLDTLTISGQVTVAATEVTCALDLPTTAAGSLTLRASATSLPLSLPSPTAALTATGTDDAFTGMLPPALLGLAHIKLTAYSIEFAPAGDARTATSITIGFEAGEWPLVPALGVSVSGFVLDATVYRTPAHRATPVLSVGAEVRGTLSLGTAGQYAIRAGMPPGGAWYFEITGSVPSLATLAQLAQLSQDQVTGALPPSLPGPIDGLGLSRVALLADPVSQALSRIDFRIAQTQPWPLAGGLLTVSGWTADLAITHGASGWATSGTLSGSVGLTSGTTTSTLKVRLPVPIGPDTSWTFELDDGPVHIPTIGQILKLFGAAPAALPVGLTSLGGLDVTAFTVSFDPAGATLRHVAFSAGQAGDWTIITDALSVTDVSASLSFLPATTPVGVSGRLMGTLLVAGTRVDVAMLKNDYDGGWLLRAAYEHVAHVPSFDALDPWMSPDKARGGVPATLPLGSGFDVCQVFLAFADGPAGVLRQFGFTVRCVGTWTIVPGHLSLTGLDGVLVLDYPVTTAGVSGTVNAVVNLPGADIGVTATKPTTPGANWTFSGDLLTGLTVDLMTAVNSLTSTARALPADAKDHALPTTVTIKSATVQAVPEIGKFSFAGSAGFDWEFPFGNTSLTVGSIAGTVDIPETGAPLSATLEGTLDVGSLHVGLSLVIGDAAQETVLTGTLTTADAQNLQIDSVTDGIAASSDATKWASVVPASLTALQFGVDTAAYLNLSTSKFLLYGAMSSATGLSANAIVYLARGTTATPWTYAVGVSLGTGFQFGALLPALAVIDQNLHVTEARLVICSLGSGTLGDLAQTTTTLLGAVDPDAPAPLSGLAGEAQPLSTGVYFVAGLDFAAGTLFNRVLQIGTDAKPPSVSVVGVIDKTDPTQTQFSADLPDITILDTITLTHDAANTGIHLSYQPAKANEFKLAGRIQLDGIFQSDYQFDVTLRVNDTGLTSTALQTTQAITNPFGLPGIVLSELSLTAAYTWAVPARNGVPARPGTSRFTLTGHIRLGPAPVGDLPDQRLSCDTSLVLRSGVPALVYASLAGDFSIGGFLTQCVTGQGATWPADYVDIALTSGSYLYYYSEAADPGGELTTLGERTFTDGFHIDAHIRLTLLTEVTLHGLLSVDRDPTTHAYTGVTAKFQLGDPIDLVFVTLAGKKPPATGQPYTGGPELGIVTGAGTTTSLVLDAGINFLGAAFAAAAIKVRRGVHGGVDFTGTLTAATELPPFGVLSFGFTYKTDPGPATLAGEAPKFTIQGWPAFEWEEDIVDFVQAIKKLANTSDGSPCGQLANFVVNQTYTSTFSITPSVSASGDNLLFALTGTYALTITTTTTPFVSATMPTMTVTIPKTTRLNELAEKLAAGIESASADFAQNLMADPAKIAVLLAMLTGPKAASVALELACNGLVDGATAAAADAAATAIAALGGATAAGAALAAITAAAKSIADSGGGHDAPGDQIGTPVFKSIRYESGAITGTWGATRNAADYTFEVLRPDSSVLATQNFKLVLTGSLAVVAAELPAGTYQGRVRGRRGDTTGPWSATLPIVKPVAPSVSVTYAGSSLSASWPDAHADDYAVRFYDPAGGDIGLSDIPLAGNVLAATRTVPDPVEGVYSVQLRMGREYQFPGDWGTPAPFRVVTLATPVVSGVTRADGMLNVTWTGGSPTGGYEVQVRSGTSTVADTTVTGTTAALNSAALTPGATYAVMVRARGDGVVSLWAEQDFTVLTVPSSAWVQFVVDSGSLVASWEPITVGGREGPYHLELFDVGVPDHPVGALVAQNFVSPVTRADGQPPAPGSRYRVRVRAEAQGNFGAWATSEDLVVCTPLPPVNPTLTAAGATLSLSWTPGDSGGLATPLAYDVILAIATAPDKDAGKIEGTTVTTVSPVRGDGRAPAPKESYLATVRMRIPRYTSGWATSASVTIMDTVKITGAAYDSTAVTIDWAPSVVRTATYEVNVVPATGGAGLTVPVAGQPGAPAPAHARVITTGLPSDGAYTVRVRAVSPGSQGDWSTPVTAVAPRPPGALGVGYDGAQVTAVWFPAAGATGYLLTLTDPAGVVALAQETTGPGNSAALPAAGLSRGVTYTATVATLVGTAVSPPSAGMPVTLIDPPSPITARYTVAGVSVSWPVVTGAKMYKLVIFDLDGREVVTVDTESVSLSFGGVQVVDGVGYQVKVAGSADVPGPFSPLVPVAQADFSCLCLGTSPGLNCGGDATVGDFTEVHLGVSQPELDSGFRPSRTPARSGWVSVPPGRAGTVAALARLTGLLATKKVLQDAEALDVFTKSEPAAVKSLSEEGQSTCLCLGTNPGAGCGNGGIDGAYTTVYTHITGDEVAGKFLPAKTPPARTGWVAVDGGSHLPLAVLVQLVTVLAWKGKLTGDEPYDVFNQTMTSTVRAAVGGTTTCVALGSPVGQACRTAGGRFGDVTVNVPAADLDRIYQPGPDSGWTTIGQQDYSVLSAILRLVDLLYRKKVLAGSEPYDIFNKSTPSHVS